MTDDSTTSEKRVYNAPRLEKFGPIAKLTTQNNNKPGTRPDGDGGEIGNRGIGG